MRIDRKAVFEKYNGNCAYCGEELTIKKMQVDHIIPKLNFFNYVSMGYKIPEFLTHLTVDDLNHIDNLNPSCRQCNFYKGSHHLELFRSELKTIHKRIMKPFISRLGAKYGIVQINDWNGVFFFEKQTNDLTTKTNNK